jgi:mono/diheme cytochrome c family protein
MIISMSTSAKIGAAALALLALAAPLALATANAQGAANAAALAQGRQLFTDWSCGSCHVLKDAGGTGQIGPALDGNAKMSKDFIVGLVSNGQGAMPGFGGLMSDEEIAVLADYIVATKQ